MERIRKSKGIKLHPKVMKLYRELLDCNCIHYHNISDRDKHIMCHYTYQIKKELKRIDSPLCIINIENKGYIMVDKGPLYGMKNGVKK